MQDEQHIRLGRRQFLRCTGAAAVGSAVASTVAAEQKDADRAARSWDPMGEVMKYRKVDSHNHISTCSPEKIVEAADRLGIERVAISIPRGDRPHQFRESNDRILNAMKKYPDRLLGQCFINPAYPKEAIEEVVRCIDQGMIGLGELYTQVKINDPLYYPIIEKCTELQAPVLMHARADLGLLREGYHTEAPPTTSIADDFADIGRRYPEAIIIHGHIGGGGDWEYMCKRLRSAPSIFIDTSGSITDEGMVEFAVKHLGVERMLFATDINFETGVGKILAADLTEEQRRKLFWDNFNDILRRRGNHAD